MAESLTLPAAPAAVLRVALIGNPNTGKSTVFNALAGMNARTGNYPGVTIEKKVGRYRSGDTTVELIDLPGTYSLAPRSPDELVAVDVLTGETSVTEPIDAILCVVSATQLQRNLFLVSQILELGKPVVLAINMSDVAESRGQKIDIERLSQSLGIPVVATAAARRRGIEPLREALERAATGRQKPMHARPLPAEFYAIRDQFRQLLLELPPSQQANTQQTTAIPDDYVLERALLDVDGEAEARLRRSFGDQVNAQIRSARQRINDQLGSMVEVESNARYAWAAGKLAGTIQQTQAEKTSWTDRLDAIFTHRVFGLLLFALMMFLVFQTIYSLAQWPMEWFTTSQDWLSDLVASVIPPGILRSLIIDGAIAGVGGVLIFLPQIALLFLFIALLEDCGYMARAAFLVDRVMSIFGLSGKSFLPLMSSFACAVPGVMATRVIENRRDRLATIMVAPLMSCSARLPVYLLMIAAFVPATTYLSGWVTLHGLVLMAMYAVGVVAAIPVAWLLKMTFLRGEPAPFVLEMPEYKVPSPRVILERVYQSCKAFVIRAGTLIFSASILIWAAGYFPGDHSQQFALMQEIETLESSIEASSAERVEAEVAEAGEALAPQLELLQQQYNTESGRLLASSLLGRTGQWIEPVVKPLGWDWKIGVGAIASFPAREVIIATLGTIYSLGGETEDEGLIEALQAARWPDGRPVYTLPVAISIMVFFALCAQCVSTLLVIKRETNSWRWPIVSFVYMTGLAYLGALVVYQVGSRL
ncbi:ferrous iron transport protein B [Planctomycetaceae bacterium SH139]